MFDESDNENRRHTKEQDMQSNPEKNKSLLRMFAITAAVALVFGMVGGAAFQGASYLFDKTRQGGAKGTGTDIGEIIGASGCQTLIVSDVASVVETVMPSVAAITNTSTVTEQYRFGQSRTYETRGSGSGILIGKNEAELLVVTNYHVIEGADTISVTFIDGQAYEAQIKGVDSNNDLAVIAISLSSITEDTINRIKIAVLGESDSLTVGEPAIAIGNALGYGQSVTTGVISALDRQVKADNVTYTLIQTDAAINPGNSGGALLNIRGEVIGINAVKFTSSNVEGMGYAIPISYAIPIIDELKLRETMVKVDEGEQGNLAIQGIDVTAELSSAYNVPMGVYIASVERGSSAEEAGLAGGDVITALEGISIISTERLQDALAYYAAGTEIELTILRVIDGEYKEIHVKVILDKK